MKNKTVKTKSAELLRICQLNRELSIIETFISDYKKLKNDLDIKRYSLVKTALISGLFCLFLVSLGFLLKAIFPHISSICLFFIFMSVFSVILFLNFLKYFSYVQDLHEYREILSRLELKRSEKITQLKSYPHS